MKVMPTTLSRTARPDPVQELPRWRVLLPGLALCLGAAGTAYGLNRLLPQVSALLIAIVLGVVLANVVRLPTVLQPGIDLAAKKLLRAGIVLLGLQLVLTDILDLGLAVLAVVVVVVASGLFVTWLVAPRLGINPTLALLIGSGFSICGAAAVAGVAGILEPDEETEESTVTAVALVVIFGTLMIPVIPVLSRIAGLDAKVAGMWAGGSIHEVAQVVAAGGIIGGGALAVAVVVKLARVLLMAPIVAVLSVRQRRRMSRRRTEGGDSATGTLPPIVPLFIVGFVAMVVVRTVLPVPEIVLGAGGLIETVLLAAAMFALGTGVRIGALAKVGLRPFLLAAITTVVVATVAGAGVVLVSATS